MTPFEAGRKAERIATNFLERKGCTIVARNWRTRRCEIDVIAEREGIVYFCEVKYRSHNYQGSGLDYITPMKLRQMRFAAEVWVATYGWDGPYELCAIELCGPHFKITKVIKDL